MNTENRKPARDPQELGPLIVARAQAGDIDGMVALYEPEAVLVTGETTVARGHSAIHEFWAKAVAAGRSFSMGEQQPAVRTGDLALTSTRLPDGRTTAEVARRQPDGTWLWVIDQPTIAK